MFVFCLLDTYWGVAMSAVWFLGFSKVLLEKHANPCVEDYQATRGAVKVKCDGHICLILVSMAITMVITMVNDYG